MSRNPSRIVITGVALNTPLGDSVEEVFSRLLAGESGVRPWQAFEKPPSGAAIGGDLSSYDLVKKSQSLSKKLPAPVYARLAKMLKRVPWSVKLSLLVAADAAISAGWWPGLEQAEVSVLVAGHNLSPRYAQENWEIYQKEPDYIDALLAVHMLDTTHSGCVSELLQTHGGIATVGASCASGNLGLRAALDELQEGADAVLLVGAAYDYGPATLQGLGRMGATTEDESPATASRPFDVARSGFVPSHGTAAVVLESLEHAQGRGARILAELVGVEASSDACHRPPRPQPEAQALLIQKLLAEHQLSPHEIDLVSAHAASTPVGDLAEGLALELAFGENAVPVNAVKSMLGHTGWSAALVETVIAVAQLAAGEVHGTANLQDLDPRLAIQLTARQSRPLRAILNNAFGFGGLNCVSLLRRIQ